MNYRHSYHAGNFADVVKHAVLSRLIVYMQRKEAAFRILDTHAGPGLYDLAGEEAGKTGEWRDGIGRLFAQPLAGEAGDLLAPYLNSVQALNDSGDLTFYPGSPKLARMLMRKQDRLSAIELHEVDAARLADLFAGDHQARVTHLDGWLALKAHLPPKERRAIVLIDPPFENPGEFDRMTLGLQQARRRFPTGVFCLWYPIKTDSPPETFHTGLSGLGLKDALCAEVRVGAARRETGLTGCGMVVVNPPWTLRHELETLLPALCERLARATPAQWRCFDVAAEPMDR